MRKRNFTSGAASVVVIGVDGRGMGLIRECLGAEAVLPTHSTPYDESVSIIHSNRPNVVVMGFDQDFDEAVRIGTELSQEMPQLQLVAISERTDPERIRAAMRAGYREYVVLPEDGSLLRQAVHEAAYGEDSDAEQGEVIAVIGSKGGSGVTFLTTNLAAELALFRVCVLDFDFNMGDVASFLDLRPASNIQDVLRNLGRLDARMLVGSVAVHNSKVHVLAQPTELMDSDSISGEDILRVLTATADAYQYVLVDCGSGLDEATLTASTVADTILLVCNPDVPSVKNAWRRLQLLDRLGVERSAVRLIVNRWGKNAGISLKDIETNLGVPVAATISDDPQSVSKAINVGQLIREFDKKSPATNDISEAIALITEGVPQVESAAGGARSFWKGLFS